MFRHAFLFLLISGFSPSFSQAQAQAANHAGLLWVAQPTQLSAYSIERREVVFQLEF